MQRIKMRNSIREDCAHLALLNGHATNTRAIFRMAAYYTSTFHIVYQENRVQVNRYF